MRRREYNRPQHHRVRTAFAVDKTELIITDIAIPHRAPVAIFRRRLHEIDIQIDGAVDDGVNAVPVKEPKVARTIAAADIERNVTRAEPFRNQADRRPGINGSIHLIPPHAPSTLHGQALV